MRGLSDDKQNGVIVNETFVRDLGLNKPVVGTRLDVGGSDLLNGRHIVGVVKDYQFTSQRQQVLPMMLVEDPKIPLNDILVRVSPVNIPTTIEALGAVWKTIAPGVPFSISFLDQDVQRQYSFEMRWSTIVEYSSLFALALSCMGLFGMVTLSVSRRTKEIGIRKVLGASVTSVAGLVSKEFVGLVLLANVIAWPAAYFAANKWLEDYASRIQLDIGLFVEAGGLALIVAMITIIFQVIRTSMANPVEALRYE
jgi:putative ABC transport system permease protein